MSFFERTNVAIPFWEELMTNLTPGPALIVRRETSDVSVSVMEPMTFQESDCVFTALDQRSISNNHSASLKEKECAHPSMSYPRAKGMLVAGCK